jgi:hypothetical protein
MPIQSFPVNQPGETIQKYEPTNDQTVSQSPEVSLFEGFTYRVGAGQIFSANSASFSSTSWSKALKRTERKANPQERRENQVTFWLRARGNCFRGSKNPAIISLSEGVNVYGES